MVQSLTREGTMGGRAVSCGCVAESFFVFRLRTKERATRAKVRTLALDFQHKLTRSHNYSWHYFSRGHLSLWAPHPTRPRTSVLCGFQGSFSSNEWSYLESSAPFDNWTVGLSKFVFATKSRLREDEVCSESPLNLERPYPLPTI